MAAFLPCFPPKTGHFGCVGLKTAAKIWEIGSGAGAAAPPAEPPAGSSGGGVSGGGGSAGYDHLRPEAMAKYCKNAKNEQT